MRTPPTLPRHQHGALLILLVIALGVLAAAVFVGMLSSSDIQNQRDKTTAAALAEAKAALIGYAVNPPSTPQHLERPGELPCPDTHAPGTAGYGYTDGSCAPGAIGRLPWKSLNIDELRDGDGETLWYALDGNFRKRWGIAASTNKPINSDTQAVMHVYASNGTTLLTPAGNEAAAIVFSAGSILGNQARGTVSQQTNAANYLDKVSTAILPTAFDNATANGPFIQGIIKDSAKNIVINDRLIVITSRDLLSLAEQRVIKEVIAGLNQYNSVNHNFPSPAAFSDASCLGNVDIISLNCQSSSTESRGRIPASPTIPWDKTSILRGIEKSDPAAPTTVLPGYWFQYNGWRELFYYAFDSGSTLSLKTKQGTLQNQKIVVILAGSKLTDQSRNNSVDKVKISNYFEDENLTPQDNIYTSISTTPVPFNDFGISIP